MKIIAKRAMLYQVFSKHANKNYLLFIMIRFKFGEVYACEVTLGKWCFYEYELMKINKVYILIEKFLIFFLHTQYPQYVSASAQTDVILLPFFKHINKTTSEQGHILLYFFQINMLNTC